MKQLKDMTWAQRYQTRNRKVRQLAELYYEGKIDKKTFNYYMKRESTSEGQIFYIDQFNPEKYGKKKGD